MKKLTALLLALLFVLFAVGCKDDKKEEKKEDNTSKTVESAPEEPPENEEEPAELALIKKGIWEVVEGETVKGSYYFSENGTECKYHNAEGAGGVPFDYEIAEEKYIFHMGSADNNTEVTVKDASEQELTLVYSGDNAREEKIRFYGDMTYDEYVAQKG